ncbi:MAG TPA: polysaccharide deacetylase family protein [Planctomycetota bacterium]|jgi:peptidoglycan/xylan/chitin deacetylase (PgdA/CDA1 family)|nr:polysaccharide deacetylase family protein [Planctomycetota bacterium]
MRTVALKVDVCTHDGMRDGVPRLLALLAQRRVKASFFLSFGPDNSGKAVKNLLRPGFLKKMVKSSAPSMYGVRTMLSGTLLPARPIATRHPDLVRRIAGEGHEVAVHAWDHRRWQDHLERMEVAEIEAHFAQSFSAFESILGRAPKAVGAAAWTVTPQSLRVADELALDYAADLRGGPPCTLRVEGRALKTPQIPTTGRCIEELLTLGIRGEADLARALLDDLAPGDPAVLAVHAEVEGGPFGAVLDGLLATFAERGVAVRTLAEIAASLKGTRLPERDLAHVELPGRSGTVATAIAPGTPPV